MACSRGGCRGCVVACSNMQCTEAGALRLLALRLVALRLVGLGLAGLGCGEVGCDTLGKMGHNKMMRSSRRAFQPTHLGRLSHDAPPDPTRSGGAWLRILTSYPLLAVATDYAHLRLRCAYSDCTYYKLTAQCAARRRRGVKLLAALKLFKAQEEKARTIAIILEPRVRPWLKRRKAAALVAQRFVRGALARRHLHRLKVSS